MKKSTVTDGCTYVEIPEAGLRILCGCPENAVKFLKKAGILETWTEKGYFCESGPNIILLSEVSVQNGSFRNLAEFPVLQMLYRQGMLIPGHPGNTGAKPVLIGVKEQLEAQASYIFYGNYGLPSLSDLMDAGLGEEKARELYRIKLRFAFGAIHPTSELLDLRQIDNDAVALGGDVFLHREGINRYSFIRKGDSISVDLNIKKGTQRPAPYKLERVRIVPDEFSVIHTGESDGWDPQNPCMASIICWQGEYFLVDAGPNIGATLNALGLVPADIRGIFQTHSHDDHFVGLTELLRIDRRIEFYATPLVRKSVLRKLCALTSMVESSFSHLFDFHDLVEGEWNEVAGLEVMPRCSPHPVETDIFIFRAEAEGKTKTYAHLADIASFSVLDGMLQTDPAKPGMSPERIAAVKRAYLEPADVKKIDAGGGMIHGNPEDFRADTSNQIYISHTNTEITPKLDEIGKRAAFAERSVLFPAIRDYRREHGMAHLGRHFPGLPESDLEALVSCPRIRLDEGGLPANRKVSPKSVYLILSGKVTATDSLTGTVRNLDSGSFIGEHDCLAGKKSAFNYSAACHVDALEIPCPLYAEIVSRNGLGDTVERDHRYRAIIRSSDLFREELGGASMDELAREAQLKEFAPGTELEGEGLFIVIDGEVRISLGDDTVETIGAGGMIGEEKVLFPGVGIMKASTIGEARVLFIPSPVIAPRPILLWTVFENYERRMTIVNNTFQCVWKKEFAVGNAKIDDDHKQFFALVEGIRCGTRGQPSVKRLTEALTRLISFAREHFAVEEEMMVLKEYPHTESHIRHHAALMSKLEELKHRYESGQKGVCTEALTFTKSWILRHVLLVDRQFIPWLRDPGQTDPEQTAPDRHP